MNKPKALYLVQNSSGQELHVWAVSGNQAKRMFCREHNISPSDYWCGMSTLTARKLKAEEAKAWEANAESRRDTLIFIEGMMEIGAEAYAESKRQEQKKEAPHEPKTHHPGAGEGLHLKI